MKTFTYQNISKSILSGILIGLGVIINTQTQSNVIGAILFSFGLLVIINTQLYLYTGKIGFIDDKKNISGMLLILILIFNFIGIIITIGLYSLANNNFINSMMSTAIIKFSKSLLTLSINAIFCGMLIHFAVKNKNKIITIFAIMIFILIGAEHCIADFPYLIFNFSWINLFKFISIILGNSIGAIIIERLYY